MYKLSLVILTVKSKAKVEKIEFSTTRIFFQF